MLLHLQANQGTWVHVSSAECVMCHAGMHGAGMGILVQWSSASIHHVLPSTSNQ